MLLLIDGYVVMQADTREKAAPLQITEGMYLSLLVSFRRVLGNILSSPQFYRMHLIYLFADVCSFGTLVRPMI